MYDDADHLKFSESFAMKASEFAAQILTPEPNLDPRQVQIEVMTIGGGGQGAVDDQTAYGGFPGLVARKKIWLSEITGGVDGDVYGYVGAGGYDPGVLSDVPGFGSYLSMQFTDRHGFDVGTNDGLGGTRSLDTQHEAWRTMVTYGARYVEPSTLDSGGVSNPFGPGGGGHILPSSSGIGGIATTTSEGEIVLGGAGSGADAFFLRYLEFGSGAGSVTGGDQSQETWGGFPGGGGGAAKIGWLPGRGGNGEIRVQATVWETY